jgi:hypothetical protein
MRIDTETQLSLLSEGLEIEYRGAVPGHVVRDVVMRTARELQRTDGTPVPPDALGSAVKRRLVRLITLPRPRRSAD